VDILLLELLCHAGDLARGNNTVRMAGMGLLVCMYMLLVMMMSVHHAAKLGSHRGNLSSSNGLLL
jgi:hypothetical protein